MDYKDKKIAIVTGGAKGIGKAIVQALSKNGYIVILDYRHTVPKKEDFNENVDFFQADVSVNNNCLKVVDHAMGKYGHIDLLVNNAGVDEIKPFTDYTDDEFDYIVKNNLYSVFFMSRAVARPMINQKSGNIINISSIWGLTGASCEVPYSMTKAAIDGLTKSLAKELGPSNIRVNSIAPGIIDTDMNQKLSKDDLAKIQDEIPLEKIGSPKDVANLVLAIDKNRYITGQVIQINGGWYI